MKWPFFKKKESEQKEEENLIQNESAEESFEQENYEKEGVSNSFDGDEETFADKQSKQMGIESPDIQAENQKNKENLSVFAADDKAADSIDENENADENGSSFENGNVSANEKEKTGIHDAQTDNEEDVNAGLENTAAEKPGRKSGFFQRLKEGLAKTRNNIVSGLDAVFKGFSEIDDDFYEELEEILIMGDIGVHTTENILESLKKQVKENKIKKPGECKEFLIQTMKEQMKISETAYRFEEEPSVVFVIGVNGVGKTTSIGKLASNLKAQGRKVLLAAADTFRAAAGDQLAEWSHRAGVEMIGGVEGADPASVLYDAVSAAKARKVDVLLCDTAGRLHNKKNLMEELKKMNRIIDREFPEAHRENLIVLDASTGQNALMQAREFKEVADLTGIILTKMDGTAKGGIAVAIQSELGIPVKYIGVGERIEDLQKFDPDTFIEALFDVAQDENETENAE